MRFPGKSLHLIKNKPMLQYLIEKLAHCQLLDGIMLATSKEVSDDPIAMFCAEKGVPCCRGPLDDVAGRFSQVVQTVNCDAFVRVNGDSPLLDFRLVDYGVELFRTGDYDLVTNVSRRTFPKGESVEVVRSSTFLDVYKQMSTSEEVEHVTKYFYDNSNKFKILNFESGAEYGDVQLSVDTPEEMRLFDAVISVMERPHWEYTFTEVMALSDSVGVK